VCVHLDDVGRSLIMRGLWLAMPRLGRRAPTDARRILVLRHDRIGDMLMSTGLIQALASLPGARIDVAASAANAPVLEHDPAVASTHIVGEGQGSIIAARRSFAKERYDAVIDGLALKPRVNSRTALLLWASGAPVRIGIGGRPYEYLFTHPVRPPRADAHHVEYLAALLAPFGLRAEPAPVPRLVIAARENTRAFAFWEGVRGLGPRLLVNVSAGDATRRWPDDRFQEVLQRVRRRFPSIKLAITGAPAERAAYEALAQRTGGSAFSGTLRDALALVSTADVVLTPDTSVAHAAAAADRRQVVMLPSVVSRQFVPYHLRGRALYTEAPTLDGLDVETVWLALQEVIQAAIRDG
jgi:ADP-heptose:LPS heptosyltransferase